MVGSRSFLPVNYIIFVRLSLLCALSGTIPSHVTNQNEVSTMQRVIACGGAGDRWLDQAPLNLTLRNQCPLLKLVWWVCWRMRGFKRPV